MKDLSSIKNLLDEKAKEYNNKAFIVADPISIPHSYTKKQDIEITAFWTAMLSWGQRKTIINKAKELFATMGDSPHDFMLNHKEKHREQLLSFKHRTFQPIDTLYFLEWFQNFYRDHNSLEEAFIIKDTPFTIESALSTFHDTFFGLAEFPERTRKHVSTPIKNSSCKRLNMFLRWMVRSDNKGVDFGLWDNIPQSELHIPLDVHVHRVATRLKLIKRKQSDWKTVKELTEILKKLRPSDPAIYDYALFGIGVMEQKK